MRYAVLLLAIATSTAHAEDPKTILFYGNSFTIGIGSTEAQNAGGVPGVVASLATAAGHPTPNVENAAVSGQTLTWHLANNLSVISSPQDFTPSPGFQWDHVVIQGFSTRPTHIGNLPQFRSDVVDVYDAVIAHSPGVTPILYETWARGPGHSYYTGASPEFPGGPAQMQQELRDGYELARQDVDAAYAPGTATVALVGDTWESTGWDDLHASDIYHANSRGTYLAALVLFGTIYHESTAGLPVVLPSITPQEAAELQAYADALLPDPCGFAGPDCNSNCIPDARESDCNGNAVPDECDLSGATSSDCNTNAVPDECESIQQLVWSDDFETDTSAGWNVVTGGTGDIATFAYDYAVRGIPSAPNAGLGETRGLMLQANTPTGPAAASGVCAYPTGLNVSGDFVLGFDMYLSWDSPGTTEHACFGVLHDGIRLNASSAISSDTDGVFFAADSDGDVSPGSNSLDGTVKDYNAYYGVNGAAANRQPLANWDHAQTFFQNLFPAVAGDPIGSSVAGSCGRQWVRGEIAQLNGVITWKLNDAVIASAQNTSGHTAGTIMLGLFDHFSGQHTGGNAFVIYDNVQVTAATTGVSAIVACMTGPCVNPPCYPAAPANCCLADEDADGDIDLVDYSLLQAEFEPPPPALAFAPASASFSLTSGTDTDQTSVTVNASDDSTPIVSLTAVDADTQSTPAWLTIPASAAAGNSFNVTVDATGLSVGAHVATITATSAGYDAGTFTVTLAIEAAVDDPTILIDFGSSSTQTTSAPRTWNNIHGTNMASTVGLVNIANNATGINFSITPGMGFNGANTSGTTTPPPGSDIALRGYPAEATQDSLFGNDVTFSGGVFPVVEIVLTGLDPAATYEFTFCASRMGVGDDRSTEYAVAGGNSGSATLDASGNDSDVVTVAGITPDAQNKVTITVDKGASNNNSTGFYYLGIMEITWTTP